MSLEQPAIAPLGDSQQPADILIAGGGLAGSLIAWRLQQKRPDLTTLLVERGETLGGNHTWSFHSTDVPPAAREWITPLIEHAWDNQEVRFPAYNRPLETGYCSIPSTRLHDVIAPSLGTQSIVNGEIDTLDANTVTLATGQELFGKAVIDARGQRGFQNLILGYQKFVGCVFRFSKPHGFTRPIIMDATVPQLDGYRFVYVLPYSEDTALIEDTYYADGDNIDTETTIGLLKDYCRGHGLTVADTLHIERGVLPVAMGGDIEAHLAEGTPGVATVGLRAGLFHPLTGYSLPDAVAVADLIASTQDHNGPALAELTHQHAVETWKARSFYRMLSRFLFDAAKPSERYLVMQRFYRLNQGLVERFYAGRSEARDKLRVLAGKPPVNFFKAVACVDERQWSARALTRLAS